jgi:hypothetical protein
MKNIFRLLALSVLVAGISSCEKTEKKDYYEGGTPPVLTTSVSTVSLEPGQEANTAIVLNWTNPDYRFTSGTSSQDVNYTIEMDTLGANFTSAKKVSSVVAKDLTKSYTVAELNSILGNDMSLQLNPRRNYTIQLRVISSIGTVVKLTSNIVSFVTKPFQPPPKVEPPVNGTLWIVGNAPSGPPAWSNPVPAPYDVSFKFTKLSNTLYELTVPMLGGGGYKLIQIQGDWGSQYHMTTGAWNAGDFEKKDSDPQFPGPPLSGNYKITVDFQLGKYTVIKL